MLKGAATAWASVVGVVALAIGAAGLSISTSSSASETDHAQLASLVRPPLAPRGWKVVSYDGVHVDVPDAWPVVDGMHTGSCGGPFPTTPTAFVGPGPTMLPTCGPPSPRSKSVRYGVWLDPQPQPQGGPTVTLYGHRFQVSYVSFAHLEDIWFHGIGVEIGTGPDAALVKHILDSIGYTHGLPNTPAAGTCAMSNDPNARPTPERLSKRLSLDQGSEVLEPPFPTQHAVMSASSAWAQFEPKELYEQYRLILARFFSALPARLGPGGSSTPMNDGQLDWLIYSSPISASIQGCGGWGLDVFDATTGQGVESDGWMPGP